MRIVYQNAGIWSRRRGKSVDMTGELEKLPVSVKRNGQQTCKRAEASAVGMAEHHKRIAQEFGIEREFRFAGFGDFLKFRTFRNARFSK